MPMQNNSSRTLKHEVFEDKDRHPIRIVTKDDSAVITDDFSMYDSLSCHDFDTSVVVKSGDGLRPIPKRGFASDGVHGRDNLEQEFTNLINE